MTSRERLRKHSQFPGWSNGYRAGQALFPVCGIFAILGLVVGMGARFLFPAARRVGKRPYWLFVILAGMAAVLIVALPYWASLIPYLVLIALEAVRNAMHHRLVPGPGFSARLLRAGLDASVAAGVCLSLAVALAGDFERLRRGSPWTTSGLGRGLRLFLLGRRRRGRSLHRDRDNSQDSSLVCGRVPSGAGSCQVGHDRVLLRSFRGGHGCPGDRRPTRRTAFSSCRPALRSRSNGLRRHSLASTPQQRAGRCGP